MATVAEGVIDQSKKATTQESGFTFHSRRPADLNGNFFYFSLMVT